MSQKKCPPCQGRTKETNCSRNASTVIPGRRAGGVVEPSGRVWPNGEFSIGYAPCGGAERLKGAEELAAEWYNSLGLSLDSNSHTPKDHGAAKRGAKGLTPHGKRVLRNSVWKLQKTYGRSRLSFVTLTLPSVDFEESWYVSSNWAEICRVFYQKLSRRLESYGLPGHYVGCTEMQVERCDREQHPALHLHFVCVGRKSTRSAWAISPSEFREMWSSVLSIYLPGERDYGATENVQMVKKDAGAYLSKYCSKGIALDRPPRSDETGWSLPSCWYNVSLKLRRWVIENVRTHPEFIDMLERVITSGMFGQGFEYCYSGTIPEMTGPGPHYHAGKLTPVFLGELIEIWKVAKFGGV